MKTKTIKLVIMALAVIMMACGGQQNRNKDKTTDTTMSADSLNRSGTLTDDESNMAGTDVDRTNDFIKEAASGSLMEIELARYAQQNAQNARVKNYAAMMVRDHSKVNDELKGIASSKNLTLPTTMEDNHREMMSDIQKKTGADFDRAYMKEMVDDHEKDVNKFKRFAEEDDVDPDLKSFASKTLPVLLMHQDSAKKISDALR